MAETPRVFVICSNNCLYEGMTKEQILTAIAQAIETGVIGNCDTGFITTIKTINGKVLKFFVGDQNEYDALSNEDKQNIFAIITNDNTKEELLSTLEELKSKVAENTELAEELTKNEPHYLKGLKEGNTRYITSSSFDINTLCNNSNCGVYAFPFKFFAKSGAGINFPSDLDPALINTAKLIVEADSEESIGAIYQTLMVNLLADHSQLMIYHRVYKNLEKEFNSWQRIVSAEELKTGAFEVAKSNLANEATKAQQDYENNIIHTTYGKLLKREQTGTLPGKSTPIYNFSNGSILSYVQISDLENPEPGKIISYYTNSVGEYLVYNKTTNMCTIVDTDTAIGDYWVLSGTWQYCCKIGDTVDSYGATRDIWLIQRIG